MQASATAKAAPLEPAPLELKIAPEPSPSDAELLRANAELSRANAELSRSNAELEQFAWVASHDLNEPLRMIGSWLDLLNQRCGDQLTAEGKEFLQFARTGAARMRSLVDDLLRFARLNTQAISLQRVNPETALTAAFANLDAAIRETHAEIECAALPDIVVDAGLLTLVFQNLIGNAIKFRGVDIPRIRISVAERAEGWAFLVSDNGIGIPPEQQSRVFKIFERLHSADEYPGNGIGLAMVQRIVERHGGQAWLESTVGEGSTFFFVIPESGAVSETSVGISADAAGASARATSSGG